MTPSCLYASRTAYQKFDRDLFRRRIYQEVRRQKFERYLNDDRDRKAEAQRQRHREAIYARETGGDEEEDEEEHEEGDEMDVDE